VGRRLENSFQEKERKREEREKKTSHMKRENILLKKRK
jgi:hypothetical protein